MKLSEKITQAVLKGQVHDLSDAYRAWDNDTAQVACIGT